MSSIPIKAFANFESLRIICCEVIFLSEIIVLYPDSFNSNLIKSKYKEYAYFLSRVAFSGSVSTLNSLRESKYE